MGQGTQSTGKQGGRERAAGDPEVLRTCQVPGLDGVEGRVVLRVAGDALYAVDVSGDTATLTTGAGGPARVMVSFDSRETLEEVLEGRLHPIVAALQGRATMDEGDRRFGLGLLLALRVSAPAFAAGRA